MVNLLIADDNAINLFMNVALCKKTFGKNAILHTAENGKDALEFFINHYPQLDGVLLDNSMPVMTGYEAAQRMRQHEKVNGLEKKVIVSITGDHIAITEKNEIDQIFHAVFSKPPTKDNLDAIRNLVLSNKK